MLLLMLLLLLQLLLLLRAIKRIHDIFSELQI
jgi:hypothetical protein